MGPLERTGRLKIPFTGAPLAQMAVTIRMSAVYRQTFLVERGGSACGNASCALN